MAVAIRRRSRAKSLNRWLDPDLAYSVLKLNACRMTPKQTRFVQEYLVDLCATQAAIRAGYSEKTADVQGCKLLRLGKVQAAVDAAKQARAERTLITQDEVITGLKAEATFHDDGASHGARVSAWAHLGKHLKLFEDKSTFDGKLTIEVVKFGDDYSPDEQRRIEEN